MIKRKKIVKRIMIAVIVLLALCIAAMGFYLSDSHGGDEKAQAAISSPAAGITVTESSKTIAFMPPEIKGGIIFYPGAKIHADAYAPLAEALAENGYACILVNMPLNLAMLDKDAAIEIESEYPEITNWYIAGHSMGGLAAEHCAYDNPSVFSGLIVLASRIQYDFSSAGLRVLAIYATNDGICSAEVLAKETTPDPAVFTKLVIEGGCHGYFGWYGDQFMDGVPTITRDEQFRQTLDGILSFLRGN